MMNRIIILIWLLVHNLSASVLKPGKASCGFLAESNVFVFVFVLKIMHVWFDVHNLKIICHFPFLPFYTFQMSLCQVGTQF